VFAAAAGAGAAPAGGGLDAMHSGGSLATNFGISSSFSSFGSIASAGALARPTCHFCAKSCEPLSLLLLKKLAGADAMRCVCVCGCGCGCGCE
jgi:hypothetical protein